MIKITEQEFNSTRSQRSMNGIIIDEIKKLAIGEGIEINFNEWKTRSDPSAYLNQVSKKENKKFRTHTVKSKEVYQILRIQ